MAWDDTKAADDLIASSEWNTMVTDQKGRVVGTSVNEAIADTSANLPTAGTSGRLFFETDTGRVLYDNGTSWVEVGLTESQISGTNINDNSVSVAGNSVSLGGSTTVDYIDLNDTGSNFPIPNSDLSNSSVSVAGNSVNLGGSTTVAISDLSDVQGITDLREDTNSNRPAAGTEGRIFLESDTGKVLYDNGTSWIDLGLSESQISLANLGSNAHSDLSSITSSDHHIRPSAGSGLTENSNSFDLTNDSITVANTSIALGNSGTPEVDKLNGNNGTSGQFLQTDGTNLSFADVSGGMTTQERQAFNDLVAQLARNDFADNLSEMAYDGGLFDVFRDESKIATKTDVNVKTLTGGDSKGGVEIAKYTVEDDFEDGDYTSNPSWTDLSSNSMNVNNTDAYSGSYSLEGSGSTSGTIELDMSAEGDTSLSDGDTLTFWYKPTETNGEMGCYFYLTNTSGSENGSDNFLARCGDSDMELQCDNGSGSENQENLAGVFTVDNWHKVIMEFDTVNGQVRITVEDTGGSQLGQTAWQGYSNPSSIQYSDIWYRDGYQNWRIDLIETFFGSGFLTSGSLTSTSKDLANDGFSNPPTSVVLSQKATIPTDEDIQYVIRDGNGNTVTITQSDVNTEVDCSNFTSTVVEVEPQLSSTDGNDTPTLNDYMAHFKE